MSQWLIFITMLLQPGGATAQTSCLPTYTALQSLHWLVPAQETTFSHSLLATRNSEVFISRVKLTGHISIQGLRMKVYFDPRFEGVSLPYNLMAIMVIRDGETLAWMDFTRGCKAVGVGFFPGTVIELPLIKTPDSPGQFQIMVWGKI